jgi:hypothetical protein
MVCYLSSIRFAADTLNALIDRSMDKGKLLLTQKDDQGLFMEVNLPYAIDPAQAFSLGDGCHVIHSAYIKTDGKVNLRAFSASSESEQLLRAYNKKANTYQVFWLDDRMEDTQVNISLHSGKRTLSTKAPIQLDKLKYNSSENAFELNKKTFKSLKKAAKSKR